MVALVDSGTPHLSAETRDLLRQRLAIASSTFFSATLAFFLTGLLIDKPSQPLVFWTHLATVFLTGGMTWLLSFRGTLPLAKLRFAGTGRVWRAGRFLLGC